MTTAVFDCVILLQVDLMGDDEFRKAYPALTITDPVSFLKHVRGEADKSKPR